MRRADCGGREVIDYEVAVADSVERVRRHTAEAELVCDATAICVEIDARERTGAERQ